MVEYLPIGDIDDYNWEKNALSDIEVHELVNMKQNQNEKVGIILYYKQSNIGITLL